MIRTICCLLLSYAGAVMAVNDPTPLATSSLPISTAPVNIAPVTTTADRLVTCAACHGPQGNSQPGQAAKLAGQNKTYLLKQLLDYKKGKAGGRDNVIMTGIVASLNEVEMRELADYYASQKTTVGIIEPQYVTLGQKIYRAGLIDKAVPACAACHGPKGEGNAEAGFPKLSGQLPSYVIDTLNAYKSKQRGNDSNHIMQDITAQLSNEEITAVANYVYGLE
ncbi:c-type cytochrome [soil metagenome]